MYKSIYVPVDNSDHSNRAVACSLALGKAFAAKLVGCHVYAAKLHDYRFRQMEYTLPEEYIDEVELERQRKIHDSLITMGLKLISDSYLDGMSRLCKESGLEFEPRMMDGKHHAEILKDLEGSQHDLVVIGALGIGRARDSVIGSVCERVARQCDRDVWVVKHVPEKDEPERDTILVGIDGSPQSFGAFMTAIDLARAFDQTLAELIDCTKVGAHAFEHDLPIDVHHVSVPDPVTVYHAGHFAARAEFAWLTLCCKDGDLRERQVLQNKLGHMRKRAPRVMLQHKQTVLRPDTLHLRL